MLLRFFCVQKKVKNAPKVAGVYVFKFSFWFSTKVKLKGFKVFTKIKIPTKKIIPQILRKIKFASIP